MAKKRNTLFPLLVRLFGVFGDTVLSRRTDWVNPQETEQKNAQNPPARSDTRQTSPRVTEEIQAGDLWHLRSSITLRKPKRGFSRRRDRDKQNQPDPICSEPTELDLAALTEKVQGVTVQKTARKRRSRGTSRVGSSAQLRRVGEKA